MEAATAIIEKALATFISAITSGNEFLVIGGALAFFVPGLVLLYKKGPWLGIPLVLAGILLVVMAIFAKTLSF
jgi:hypothetical protein